MEDIAKKQGYVITCGGRPEAYFCLSTEEEDYYSLITDGKWQQSGPYAVIHRCCVSAALKGSGLSRIMFKYAEELAREAKVQSIRFDTHRKNKPMQALGAKMGYSFRGNLLLPDPGEGHDPRRQGFEKLLK
ncbi:MAG: GNAT family N-acetyltransferase [Oscillospiraceae bacterium]|nr:GNAT family N-acetyltransferase [Oscillospiraceae bacterium]